MRKYAIMGAVPGSSMVEQEAVNFEVAGSSPVPGAKIGTQPPLCAYFDGVIWSYGLGPNGASPVPGAKMSA